MPAAEPPTRHLVVVRRAPYGASLARTAIETALAVAAFEQPVDILFMGDGVLQLLGQQDSQASGSRNMGRLLASLPLYDIEAVYVDGQAAAAYGVDLANSPVAATALTPAQVRELMDRCDKLLGF
ncbi:MAG: sulfurtransferase complex subunit TusC [Halioglobus sp.]|nr:sulfurtransferase complex subunit TusC [Halioglobus sp.]